MKRLAAATVVAKKYLSLARVLARSLRQHHPDVPFFVALADEPEGCFDPRDEPFEVLGLGDLPVREAERLRFRYRPQELSYALTPFLMSALLDRGYEAVAFFKQESLVLDRLDAIFAFFDRQTILLTPHLLAPLASGDVVARELNILLSGVYNVGFLGVAARPEARRFLGWWGERMATHCRHAVAEGLHYEQRWLDLVPAYFEGVQVLRDPGFNVGHWNLPERVVRQQGEGFTVDGRPCRFVRFSGFDADRPLGLTRYNDRLTVADAGSAGALFTRYRELLLAAGHAETSRWPYAYGHFRNGVSIPDVARRIYAALDAGEQQAFGDPFASQGETSFLSWLQQPALAPHAAGPVSHLWHGVYRERPDLQAAFPDAANADRAAFLRWAAGQGAHEYDMPDLFAVRGGP